MSNAEERVQVQTYVSDTQEDIWRDEAEEMDMSIAEYLRTMVQAGRRSFDLDTGASAADRTGGEEGGLERSTPGVGDLEDRILDVLREEEFADWERIVDGVTDGVEERIEDTLQDLQTDGRIQHSPRRGGYTVIDDGR